MTAREQVARMLLAHRHRFTLDEVAGLEYMNDSDLRDADFILGREKALVTKAQEDMRERCASRAFTALLHGPGSASAILARKAIADVEPREIEP